MNHLLLFGCGLCVLLAAGFVAEYFVERHAAKKLSRVLGPLLAGLDESRHAAILELASYLGGLDRLTGTMPGLLLALARKDFDTVSREILASDWRQVAASDAVRIAGILRGKL